MLRKDAGFVVPSLLALAGSVAVLLLQQETQLHALWHVRHQADAAQAQRVAEREEVVAQLEVMRLFGCAVWAPGQCEPLRFEAADHEHGMCLFEVEREHTRWSVWLPTPTWVCDQATAQNRPNHPPPDHQVGEEGWAWPDRFVAHTWAWSVGGEPYWVAWGVAHDEVVAYLWDGAWHEQHRWSGASASDVLQVWGAWVLWKTPQNLRLCGRHSGACVPLRSRDSVTEWDGQARVLEEHVALLSLSPHT